MMNCILHSCMHMRARQGPQCTRGITYGSFFLIWWAGSCLQLHWHQDTYFAVSPDGFHLGLPSVTRVLHLQPSADLPVKRGSQLPPGHISLFPLPQLLVRDGMGFMRVFLSSLLAVRSVAHLHVLCCMVWWQQQGCARRESHHQSCRAMERKPTNFLLSNWLLSLSTACGKCSLVCKQIWWGFFASFVLTFYLVPGL